MGLRPHNSEGTLGLRARNIRAPPNFLTLVRICWNNEIIKIIFKKIFLNNNKILRKFRTIYQICVSGPQANYFPKVPEG